MFSVFITRGGEVKGSPKPRLFYSPHPTEKRAPGKERRRARETKGGTHPGGVIPPVQSASRVREKAAWQERSRKDGKGGRAWRGFEVEGEG